MPILSVIVPAYNESKTIKQILDKIEAIDIDKEIIVVDDGSCDGTDKILRNMHLPDLKVIYHSSNRGKGAAFLTGLNNASGQYVIVQDADLEYEPSDYLKLFDEIKNNNADMVLGARFFQGYHGLMIHRLGNRLLTFSLNFLMGSRLNDYATCYKLALKDTFNKLHLNAKGFDIDVEIICNAIKLKMKIKEVHASYHPRSYSQGKKIRLKDALWAIFYMFKYRLVD